MSLLVSQLPVLSLLESLEGDYDSPAARLFHM